MINDITYVCPITRMVQNIDANEDLEIQEYDKGLILTAKCSCAAKWHDITAFIKSTAILNDEKVIRDFIAIEKNRKVLQFLDELFKEHDELDEVPSTKHIFDKYEKELTIIKDMILKSKKEKEDEKDEEEG